VARSRRARLRRHVICPRRRGQKSGRPGDEIAA
jgi:hypothetical protein